ncbi:hypothetical protein HN481_04445 [Candidatus Parcubacteria bacterium]|jgi:hypothetical protein|nr:hypothetical protein [Candidatus Parcubacteria bacterium]
MKRSLILAALAAAILVLFVGCDADGGAGNDSQYNTDVVEPEADITEPTGDAVEPEADNGTVDPCDGKLDNPSCTTDDTVEPDPEVTEPDVIESPVLTDCDHWTPIEGYWVFDSESDFEVGAFELKSGNCVSEGDPSLGVVKLLGDPYGIGDNEIVACGPNLETPAVCLRLNDDGSLTMWGDLVGDEPYTTPPR